MKIIYRQLTTALTILSMLGMVISASVAPASAASAPNIITYQGRVLDANGAPLSSSTASMKFFLYTASSGGTCVWSNSSDTCHSNTPGSTTVRTVALTNGLFTENLGDTNAGTPYAQILDSTFADNGTLYLEVIIGGETLSPRRLLTAAPYALNADTLDGIDLSVIQLWEVGTNGSYEDDAAAIVGADAAFSSASGGVGDLKVADQLEVDGAGFFESSLAVTGNSTLTGDLAVNGGDLTSTSSTFNFLDAAGNSTTIEIGGVSTDLGNTIRIATEGTTADTIVIGNSLAATTMALTGGDDWSITSAGVITGSDFICTDCLDFTELSDTLSLDASTSLTQDGAETFTITNSGTGDTIINLSSTGDFVVQDNGAAALTVNDSGNTVLAGDLTVSGDDLIMGTNTSGFLLIADGTNFNPTAVSGDIAITGTGVTTIQANSVALGTDTTGNYLATLADAGSGDLSISGSGSESAAVTIDIADDALDFTELSDTLSLDASTSLTQDGAETFTITNSGTGDTIINLSSTGDFVVQDNGAAALTVNDSGNTTVGGNLTLSTGTLDAADITCTDCLDFDSLEDTLNLDVATEIDNGLTNGNPFSINLSSTGDFTVEDEGSAYWVFNDDRSIDYSSNQTTTDPFDFIADSVTTANAFELSVDALTTGRGLYLTSTSGSATSADLLAIAVSSQYSVAGTTVSGNLFDVSRSIDMNDGNAGTNSLLTVNSPVVSVTDNCFSTGNDTCVNTGNVLSLTQSYASASGSLFAISNAGTGDSINIAGAGTGTAIDIDSTTYGDDLELQNGLTIDNDDNNDLSLAENSLSLNIDFGETLADGVWFSTSSSLILNSTGGGVALMASDTGNGGSDTVSLIAGNAAPNAGENGDDIALEAEDDVLVEALGEIVLDATNDLDITSAVDIDLAATEGVSIDAITTDHTATGGALSIYLDTSTNDSAGLYIDVEQISGAGATDVVAGALIDLTASDSDGDVTGIIISTTASAAAAAGSFPALIQLENGENTASAVTDALLVTSTSGTNGDIVDAIDVSYTTITNAINAGANFYDMDGIRFFEGATGTLTFEDTSGNDLMTLADSSNLGDLTVTGSVIAQAGSSFVGGDGTTTTGAVRGTQTQTTTLTANRTDNAGYFSLTTNSDPNGFTNLVYGVSGNAFSTRSVGVGVSALYGVQGNAANAGTLTLSNVAGVYGTASAFLAGGTVTSAVGVYGQVGSGSGTVSSGFGGYFSNTAAGSRRYGIFAEASGGGTSNHAGFFSGGAVAIEVDSTPGTPSIASSAGELYVEGDIETDGDLYVDGGEIVTSAGALTINPASYTRVGDLGTPGTASTTDDLYVSGDFEVDRAAYFDSEVDIDYADAATTLTSGLIDMDISAGDAAVDAINIALTQTTASAGVEATGIDVLLDAQDGDGNLIGLNITNQTGSTAGVAGNYEALLRLTNTETVASVVTDALIINDTGGTAGAIVDAIDVSDSDITNALNIGENYLTTSNFRLYESTTGNGFLVFEDTSGNDFLTIENDGNYTDVDISGQLSTRGDNSSGVVADFGFVVGATQSADLSVVRADMAQNITISTADGIDYIGFDVLPETFTHAAASTVTHHGFRVNGSSASVTQLNNALNSVTQWRGMTLVLPATLDMGADAGDLLTVDGVRMTPPTSATDSPRVYGTTYESDGAENEWTAEINFEDTDPVIRIASAGTLTIEDSGGNDLMTLTDNADTGDLVLTGDLTVTSGMRVGTGSTPDSITALAADSLFVEGAIEVDGAARIDGAVTATSTLAVTSTSTFTGAASFDGGANPANAGDETLGTSAREWDGLYLGDDGVGVTFGADQDYLMVFDSSESIFQMGTQAIAGGNIDYALYTIAADSTNVGMTADAEIFEIGKGGSNDAGGTWTELFAVDEDGDVSIAGDMTVATGSITVTDTANAETLFVTADSVTTGNAMTLSVDGITQGRGLYINSTSTVLNNAALLEVAKTGSSITQQNSDNYLVDFSHTETRTASNVNGGVLLVDRNLTADGYALTLGSNAVARFRNNCSTANGGTCSTSTSVVEIDQDHAGSGAGLSVQNAATGNGVFIDQDGNGISLSIDSESTSRDVIDIAAENTAGTVIDLYWSTATQSSTLYGMSIDLATVTANGTNSLYGLYINDHVGATGSTERGIYVAGGEWDHGLYVEDLVSVGLGTTSSTTAVCSSLAGATAPTAGVAYELRDCDGAPAADYAEQYPVATGINYGDIVVPGTKKVTTNDGQVISQLVKSSQPYQGPVAGIVSDNYGDFTSAGYNVPEGENPMPVALVGRVPVNVTNENGAIKVGDYLTTSSTPGHAMKATEVGRVIGMALNDFTGTSGQVMVQVHNGWFMGDMIATDGSSTVLTDKVVVAPLNAATVSEPGVDSYGLALRGSAWDGAQAQAVEMLVKAGVTDQNNYRLSVRNTTDTEVAYITNTGTMQIAGDMVISGNLYPSDRGVPQTSKYIYYDGSEGAGGDFMRTNAKGWSTGSYDFAEMFPSDETLQAGEVVVFAGDGEKVKRSMGSDAPQLVGIVSTRPGFLAGENAPGAHPIALAGRVPTRVSTENGEVKVGDPLTSSSKPGYAMKATKPGMIVGYALEPLVSGDKSLLVYVNVGYWSGEATSTTPGTNNQASGFASGTNVNYTALNMSGNIYVSGHEILSVGRIAGISDVWSIDQNGMMKTEGLLKVVTRSYTDEKVETIAVTSPESVITLTGTAKLSGGQAEVRFEDFAPSFNDVTAADAPLRVLVTPTGPVSLYVSEKDNNHFVVKQFAGEEADWEFDWMVTAYRKGYEPKPETSVIPNEPISPVILSEPQASEGSLEEPASPESPDSNFVDSQTDDEGGAQAEQPSESPIETVESVDEETLEAEPSSVQEAATE